ncbi:MAG TPA: histidine kinase [Thiobacillaceae bacterium]|nr:histidine kinase [Thiobacillaceae bacterium]
MRNKNHNKQDGVLPNFCHFGVSLKIILAVEAAAYAQAWAASGGPVNALSLLISQSALLQPALLLTLVTLCVGGRALRSLRYSAGLAVVFCLALTIPSLVALSTNRALGDIPQASLAGILMFSGILALLLLGYFHLRSKALSPAITEARLEALQARIRPHFLFNSLNAVLSLVRSDPRRAERALEDLSDLFRALMSDSRTLAPLEDEIALTRAYLNLEELRLGDRLKVVWYIDKMPADALIPPLIIQPLVENAVYHGIEPHREGGEISLNVYRSQDMVHIVIRNPYAGEGHHHAGNKIALANIRERLSLHFDLDATLKSELLGAVYQVHITLPYTRARTPSSSPRR